MSCSSISFCGTPSSVRTKSSAFSVKTSCLALLRTSAGTMTRVERAVRVETCAALGAGGASASGAGPCASPGDACSARIAQRMQASASAAWRLRSALKTSVSGTDCGDRVPYRRLGKPEESDGGQHRAVGVLRGLLQAGAPLAVGSQGQGLLLLVAQHHNGEGTSVAVLDRLGQSAELATAFALARTTTSPARIPAIAAGELASRCAPEGQCRRVRRRSRQVAAHRLQHGAV